VPSSFLITFDSFYHLPCFCSDLDLRSSFRARSPPAALMLDAFSTSFLSSLSMGYPRQTSPIRCRPTYPLSLIFCTPTDTSITLHHQPTILEASILVHHHLADLLFQSRSLHLLTCTTYHIGILTALLFRLFGLIFCTRARSPVIVAVTLP